MNWTHGSLAFGSGLLLNVVSVWLGGYLAAIAIPAGYFAFFGRQHADLALFFIHLGTFAFPVSLVSLVWCWLTFRLSKLRVAKSAVLCLAGYIAGMLYWQAKNVLNFVMLDADGKIPLALYLAQLVFPS